MGRRRQPRVWVISELYYPEETSTGYVLTRIAEGLSAWFPVGAICSQPTYSARGIRAPRREERHGVAVHRCLGTTFNKDRLMGRILNAVSITLGIFLEACRLVRRGDVVIVVTNPPMLPFVVSIASKLKRAECVLLIHDVYPDVMVSASLLAANSLLARALGAINRRLFTRVDRIVVLGRDMAELVLAKLAGVPTDGRVVIIPNWADSDEIQPKPKGDNALLKELGLTSKYVVQVAGNMGRTHDIALVVEAATRLQAESNVHFLFIGSGARRSWLEQAVRSRGLSNVTVLGTQPRSSLQTVLNACDLALIPLVGGMRGVSVPCRMYNILAAGKPILAVAEEDSELGLVVREERVGWVIPPGDLDELVAALRVAPTVKIDGLTSRARHLAETRFSLASTLAGYRALVTELFSSRPGS